MKRLTILLIALTMAMNFSMAWGENNAVEEFYRACIDKRIEKCEARAKLAEGCSSAYILCDCKIAANQALYYREKRENLVAAMKQEDITPNPHAIEHFLIKTYFMTAGSQFALCRQ